MESPVPAWGVRAIRPGGITRPFWRHLPILYRGPSPKAKTAVPVRHQNSRNWRVSEPSPGDTPQRFIVTTIYFVNVMQYIRVNGIDFYIWCHNQWYWKRNCGRYRIKYAQWLTQFICDTTHSDTPQGFIITTRYVCNTFSICNAVSICTCWLLFTFVSSLSWHGLVQVCDTTQSFWWEEARPCATMTVTQCLTRTSRRVRPHHIFKGTHDSWGLVMKHLCLMRESWVSHDTTLMTHDLKTYSKHD